MRQFSSKLPVTPYSTHWRLLVKKLHTDLFDVACLYTPHWQGLVFEVDLGGSSKLLGITLGVGNVLCEILFLLVLSPMLGPGAHAPGWHLLVCSSGFAMSIAYFYCATSIGLKMVLFVRRAMQLTRPPTLQTTARFPRPLAIPLLKSLLWA